MPQIGVALGGVMNEREDMQRAGMVPVPVQQRELVVLMRRKSRCCVRCGHSWESHDTNSYGCSECPCDEWRE